MSKNPDERGFSVIEVIIGMFLLALIAVALLPALVQGTRLSAEQSAVATATRELNALVEQARETPTCANLSSVAQSRTVTDGSGRTITTSGAVGTCPAVSKTVKITLTASTASGPIASTTAIVYVP